MYLEQHLKVEESGDKLNPYPTCSNTDRKVWHGPEMGWNWGVPQWEPLHAGKCETFETRDTLRTRRDACQLSRLENGDVVIVFQIEPVLWKESASIFHICGLLYRHSQHMEHLYCSPVLFSLKMAQRQRMRDVTIAKSPGFWPPQCGAAQDTFLKEWLCFLYVSLSKGGNGLTLITASSGNVCLQKEVWWAFIHTGCCRSETVMCYRA